LREKKLPYREKTWFMEMRIISPLEKFGLVEIKTKKGKYISEIEFIRKTILYKKFMQFKIK
jgi:hypothetical protein